MYQHFAAQHAWEKSAGNAAFHLPADYTALDIREREVGGDQIKDFVAVPDDPPAIIYDPAGTRRRHGRG